MSNNEQKVSLQLPAVLFSGLKLLNDQEQESTETLGNYIAKGTLNDTERAKDILLQLNHCVLNFHQKNITCGSLLKAPISVLKDLSPDVMKDLEKHKDKEHTKETDINLLANLYCFILTNGKQIEYSDKISAEDLKCSKSDAHVALDIIKKMASTDPPTIEEILQHPIYWDDFQKVNFICKAVDYGNDSGYRNECNTAKNRSSANFNMDCGDAVIPKGGWIQKLELTPTEVRQYRKKHGSYPPIKKDLLQKLATKKKGKEGKERLVFELALFFRNRYIHFREDGEAVQSFFGSYPSGYLSFFTERFPKFFDYVYNNFKTYLCTENAMGEFATHQSLSPPTRSIQFHVKPCESKVKCQNEQNQS